MLLSLYLALTQHRLLPPQARQLMWGNTAADADAVDQCVIRNWRDDDGPFKTLKERRIAFDPPTLTAARQTQFSSVLSLEHGRGPMQVRQITRPFMSQCYGQTKLNAFSREAKCISDRIRQDFGRACAAGGLRGGETARACARGAQLLPGSQ
jgi:hypothetical protein